MQKELHAYLKKKLNELLERAANGEELELYYSEDGKWKVGSPQEAFEETVLSRSFHIGTPSQAKTSEGLKKHKQKDWKITDKELNAFFEVFDKNKHLCFRTKDDRPKKLTQIAIDQITQEETNKDYMIYQSVDNNQFWISPSPLNNSLFRPINLINSSLLSQSQDSILSEWTLKNYKSQRWGDEMFLRTIGIEVKSLDEISSKEIYIDRYQFIVYNLHNLVYLLNQQNYLTDNPITKRFLDLHTVKVERINKLNPDYNILINSVLFKIDPHQPPSIL